MNTLRYTDAPTNFFRILCVWLLSASCTEEHLQVLGRAPKVGEIAAGAATKVGLDFLTTIQWHGSTSPKKSELRDDFGIPTWSVSIGDARLQIDAEKALVRFFRSSKVVREQFYASGKSNRFAFQSDSEAKTYVVALARKLGIPGNARLVNFKSIMANDPRISDANRAGSIRASFSVAPRDYPSFQCMKGGGLILDPQSGALVQFGLDLNTTYVNPIQKVSKAEAVKIAKSEIAKEGYRQGDYKKVRKTWLAYSLPWRKITVTQGNTRKLRVARLCWIVEFQAGTMCIDAENGSVYDRRIWKQDTGESSESEQIEG